jgi:hypothetical protein
MKNKNILPIFLFLVIILFASLGYATSKYEPADGRVLHGVGQYVPYYYTDAENWQYVTDYQTAIGHIPIIYSVYASLDPYSISIDTTDFSDIMKNRSYSYVLNIGISLLSVQAWMSGSKSIPAAAILNGDWDYRIVSLAQKIKALNMPTYVRPGFEFGTGNSGAHSDPNITPTQFKAVWIHIYNIFQNEGVINSAWVWDTVNPWMFSYMDWYPSDEYVDWWGINYFTSEQISSSDAFLNSASDHQKPVMICESCPISNGGSTNADNWTLWYSPYFNKIASFPNIKAFIYISDPWDRQGWWGDWADSQINLTTTNSMIRDNYILEMNKLKYIHMDEYLSNPSIISTSNSNGGTNGGNNYQSNNSNEGGGGGCFILTAAYGSPMENHVKLMKEFRDRFLISNSIGRSIVRLYYTCSPPVADFISGKEELKVLVRFCLLPIVCFGGVALHSGIFYAFALSIFLCSLIGISIFLLYKKLIYRNIS